MPTMTGRSGLPSTNPTRAGLERKVHLVVRTGVGLHHSHRMRRLHVRTLRSIEAELQVIAPPFVELGVMTLHLAIDPRVD